VPLFWKKLPGDFCRPSLVEPASHSAPWRTCEVFLYDRRSLEERQTLKAGLPLCNPQVSFIRQRVVERENAKSAAKRHDSIGGFPATKVQVPCRCGQATILSSVTEVYPYRTCRLFTATSATELRSGKKT
jgi:hypothetical protein